MNKKEVIEKIEYLKRLLEEGSKDSYNHGFINALKYTLNVVKQLKEQEKLYQVELPGSHKHGDIILVKDDDGDITYDVVFSDKWKERDYTKLTESEIKQDFEWAWQFAEEVEE